MKKEPKLLYRVNRKKPHEVRYYNKDGERKSRTFAMYDDPRQFMLEMSSDPSEFQIATDEKDMVVRIKRLCQEKGLSLLDMEDSIARLIKNRPDIDVSLGDAAERYKVDCQKRNLQKSTLIYYKYRIGKLVLYFGQEMRVSSITTDMLESYIRASADMSHDRRCISSFYEFLRQERLVKTNLVKELVLPRKHQKHKMPAILTVEEIERMLLELPRTCVAGFVLMTFFGVRPQELACETGKRVMMVEDIDFKTHTVNVQGETAKMGNFRPITKIPETIWKWLERYLPKEGKVFSHSYNTYLRIRNLSTVNFSRDVLRHSFASYAYHVLGQELTVEIMGHEYDYDVFCRHYKARVSPEDAMRFFSISPDIRNNLPKIPARSLSSPNFGLKGEILQNIAYLKTYK